MRHLLLAVQTQFWCDWHLPHVLKRNDATIQSLNDHVLCLGTGLLAVARRKRDSGPKSAIDPRSLGTSYTKWMKFLTKGFVFGIAS